MTSAPASSGDWRPLLEGERRAWALRRLEELAEDLARWTEDQTAPQVGLANGAAGVAVFFAYLDAVQPGRSHRNLAVRSLERAVEALEQGPVAASLFTGLAGLGWAAEYVRRRLPPPEAEEVGSLAEQLESVVRDQLATQNWAGQYDLMTGVAGLGLFAWERVRHGGDATGFVHVLEKLNEQAVSDPQGSFFWASDPDLLTEPVVTDRFLDFGVAHGVPGVAAMLAGPVAGGSAPPAASRLLEELGRWLLSCQLDMSGGDRFLRNRVPGKVDLWAKPGWCYGEPGVSVGLLRAARALARPEWEALALRLARRGAGRRDATAGIHDATFCHGAIGLAHIFNRLHQATGDTSLRDAAMHWVDWAVGFQAQGNGRLGWGHRLSGESGWHDSPGLTVGRAGVGLALAAAISDVEPEWDRLFVLS